MIRSLIAGLTVALFSIATPAIAAEQSYDCDTPADRFSELKQTLDGAAYDATGTITPRRMLVGERFLPAARVSLESADGKNFLSFRLRGMPKIDQETVIASLFIQIEGREEEVDLGPVKLTQSIPFSLHIDATGAASFSLGGWHRDLKIQLGAAPVAGVSCSTGEFKFEHLKLGS